MFHLLVTLTIIGAAAYMLLPIAAKHSADPMLYKIYKSIMLLYPEQHYFGVRVLYSQPGQSLQAELEMLSFQKIKEIDFPGISVFMNGHFDVFIVQELGPNERALSLQDIQIRRSFFYAYENIITLSINERYDELKSYLRQLSLSEISQKVTTSIWLCKCETLPGYSEISQESQTSGIWQLQKLDRTSGFLPILNSWVELLHDHLIHHIPLKMRQGLKGELIALSHQFKSFIHQIEPGISGQLARPIHFGYVLLVSASPSQELHDHLYKNWLVTHTEQQSLPHNLPQPWIQALTVDTAQSKNLQAVYVSLSLFIVFMLAGTVVSDRVTGIASKATNQQSIAKESKKIIETQLYSELGSNSSPELLVSLLMLQQEMQNHTANESRCETFQHLVQSDVNCNTVNHSKLNKLPSDLAQRVAGIFDNLSEHQKLLTITGQDFSSWSAQDLNTHLKTLDIRHTCARTQVLDTYSSRPTFHGNCTHELKSKIINSYTQKKVDLILNAMNPFKPNDSLQMIANTSKYYSENIDQLVSRHTEELQLLLNLAKDHQLDYQSVSQIKSLLYLSQQKSKMRKTLKNISEIAQQALKNGKKAPDLVLFYEKLITKSSDLKNSLSKKPADAQDQWTQMTYLQVFTIIKSNVRGSIQASWNPVYANYRDNLANHYPLAAKQNDAKLSVFTEMLAPNGQLISFFGRVIHPLINSQSGQWIWEENSLFDLGLDSSLINTNMQLALISEMYFHKKSMPWLEMNVQLKNMSNQVKSITWQVGDHSATMAANSSEIILWSAGDPNHQFSMITFEGIDGSKKQIPINSDLSAFHLLDQFKPLSQHGQQKMIARIEHGTWWADFEINIPHPINPLIGSMSKNLNFNATIILPEHSSGNS